MQVRSTQSRILGINYYARRYHTGLKKLDAFINLERSKDEKQVRQFLGMVQPYRVLWPKYSEILAPPTELTKGGSTKNGPIEWTPACTKEFQQMKALIYKETILAYPYFSKIFHDPHKRIERATGRSNHTRR